MRIRHGLIESKIIVDLGERGIRSGWILVEAGDWILLKVLDVIRDAKSKEG